MVYSTRSGNCYGANNISTPQCNKHILTKEKNGPLLDHKENCHSSTYPKLMNPPITPSEKKRRNERNQASKKSPRLHRSLLNEVIENKNDFSYGQGLQSDAILLRNLNKSFQETEGENAIGKKQKTRKWCLKCLKSRYVYRNNDGNYSCNNTQFICKECMKTYYNNCYTCKGKIDDQAIQYLICSRCDQSYHWSCIKNLNHVIEDYWFCGSCEGKLTAWLNKKELRLIQRSMEFRGVITEGREEQQAEISSFFSVALSRANGTCLISGGPGSGKTSTMNTTVSNLKIKMKVFQAIQALYRKKHSKQKSKEKVTKPPVSFLYINGNDHINSESIFQEIASSFDRQFSASSESNDLINTLVSSKTTLVVVLDELDRFVIRSSNEQAKLDPLLYKLYEWSFNPHVKLVFVGITNDIELYDQFYHPLSGHRITKVPFPPYTHEQLLKILKTKLKVLQGFLKLRCIPGVSFTPTRLSQFTHKALELCARKASSHSGDIRLVFNVMSCAIQRVDSEMIKSSEKSLINLSTISSTFRSTSNLNAEEAVNTLPRHTKILLCAIITSYKETKKSINLLAIERVISKWAKMGMLNICFNQVEFSNHLEELDVLDIIERTSRKKSYTWRQQHFRLSRSVDQMIKSLVMDDLFRLLLCK